MGRPCGAMVGGPQVGAASDRSIRSARVRWEGTGMDQRRQHYRVPIDPTTDLQAFVRQAGGDLSGQLMDVSAAGAGIRFIGEDAPNLAVGDEVDLVFKSKKLN